MTIFNILFYGINFIIITAYIIYRIDKKQWGWNEYVNKVNILFVIPFIFSMISIIIYILYIITDYVNN